jgi:SPP1 gp7 family putative phage head morphogenesis protein
LGGEVLNDDIRQLLTEADKLAAIADEVTGSFARELSKVLRDLERELVQLAHDALQGRQTALARAIRAQRLRKQIQAALKQAGYPQLVEKASTSLLDALVAQVEALNGAARIAAFTTSDFTRILALKELAKLDLFGQGATLSHAVWRTFQYGLFSQRRLNDLLDDLADTLDVEQYEARRFYDTTVNVFARQVESMKAPEDAVYAYLGPADKKTRPFCHARVGKVFTKADIDAMDNDQLPNVYLTAGGYNCRHQWIAVSKFSELREMVGTDERIPEVEAQLADVGGRKAA